MFPENIGYVIYFQKVRYNKFTNFILTDILKKKTGIRISQGECIPKDWHLPVNKRNDLLMK